MGERTHVQVQEPRLGPDSYVDSKSDFEKVFTNICDRPANVRELMAVAPAMNTEQYALERMNRRKAFGLHRIPYALGILQKLLILDTDEWMWLMKSIVMKLLQSVLFIWTKRQRRISKSSLNLESLN